MTINGIKYKYDGYRGKFFILENDSILFMDALNNFETLLDYPSVLNLYKNLVLQVEILDDCIILTDVIGAYVNKKFYMVSPMDVISFFGCLNISSARYMFCDEIKILNKSMKLFVQKLIDLSVDEPIGPIDGYIVISNFFEYKYKISTIDVLVRNHEMYLDTATKFPCTIPLMGINDLSDGVYEIMYYDGVYKILRKRMDRIMGCTIDEFETFKGDFRID